MRNLYYFCLGLLISVALFFVPYAHAFTDPGPLPQTSAIVRGLGSVTTSAVGTGVVATSAGDVLVQPSGLRIPVSVAAQVERAAIVKAAGKIAAKAIPFVGTAIALAELADLLREKGYRSTAAGDALEYPEHPDVGGDALGTGYCSGGFVSGKCGVPARIFKSAAAACHDLHTSGYASFDAAWNVVESVSGSSTLTCTLTITSKTNPNNSQIATGSIVRKLDFYVPEYILATEVQTQADVDERLRQQQEYQKTLYDAIRSDQRNYSGDWPDAYNPTDGNTPLVVTAPPVTSPERVTKTETRANPDGSTDTTTTKEKTVVSPTTTGTTVNDSRTTFPSQTVTTSTTINNVTNQTTTNTTTVEHAADQAEQSDPEDYSFADAAMPPVPDLYEQKYPDGIAGVWRDHQPNISDTQFWQGIRSMFPSFGGGSCPAWAMSFNIMHGANYGTMPFDVPCWIFQAVGLILMTTAAFTARKIIF